MDWKEKRAQFIMQDKFKGKGPCLVPKPDRQVPSCHENDFCECDMCEAFEEGRRVGLNEAADYCLCTRNTFGFDYGETHAKLGKPRTGARWLTPSDLADIAGAARLTESEGVGNHE